MHYTDKLDLIFWLGLWISFYYICKWIKNGRGNNAAQTEGSPRATIPSTATQTTQAARLARREAEAPNNDNDVLAASIARMTQAERIVLYGETFDRNQNQTVLKDSARATEDDDSQADQAPPEAPSSILSSVYGLFGRWGEPPGDDGKIDPASPRDDHGSGRIGRDTTRAQSTIVHPRKVVANDLESGTEAETSGTCVVCLEALRAGERVVWSEHASCPHVYHKDCLVEYFAGRNLTKEQILKDENPCPVCRRTFVSVCTPANRAMVGTMR